MKKGQITIPIVLALSLTFASIGAVSSYYVGKIAIADRFGETNGDVRENTTSIASLEKQFDRIEEQLDFLIKNLIK